MFSEVRTCLSLEEIDQLLPVIRTSGLKHCMIRIRGHTNRSVKYRIRLILEGIGQFDYWILTG